MGEFFYFTGVEVNRIVGVGFSIEKKVFLKLITAYEIDSFSPLFLKYPLIDTAFPNV
jgi:hypothetical protein